MSQQTDQQYLYELVEKLETDLRELKQILGRAPYSKPKIAQTQHRSRSLYGVFPRTKTTLADFREARQTWSNRLEKF